MPRAAAHASCSTCPSRSPAPAEPCGSRRLAALDEHQSWRLPQVLVEGMAWLEGTLVLVVPKPLVLDRIGHGRLPAIEGFSVGGSIVGRIARVSVFSAYGQRRRRAR